MSWLKAKEAEKPRSDHRLAVAAESWRGFFETALLGLLDYEMRGPAATNAVAMAAEVADAAQNEFEKRWAL